MRKLFWGGLLTGLALAAGLVGLEYHACGPTESIFSRCLAGASSLVNAANPVTGLVPLLVQRIRPVSPEAADAAGELMPGVEVIPDDPMPVAEPVTEPVAEPVPAPAAVVEGPAPAPIVIPEEDPVNPAIQEETPPAMPHAVDRVAFFKEGEEDAMPASCRMLMPYCSDEEEEQADEGNVAQAVHQDPPKDTGREAQEDALLGFWKQVLEMLHVPTVDTAPAQPEPAAPAATPVDCREDSHHHRHYPACPYTGRCYPPVDECPQAQPSKPNGCGVEPAHKPVETPRPKLQQPERDKGECPSHPEIDTMEYRPSDGSLYDYGTGPV
jgi:hypothetical protein